MLLTQITGTSFIEKTQLCGFSSLLLAWSHR